MWHGCANIDGRYPDRSGTNDRLPYTQGLISNLGFRTAKLEWSIGWSTKYSQNPWGAPTNLVQLVQDPVMAATLADASFDRFQANIFSMSPATNNPWAGAWTDAVGDSIETEFYNLCVHLRNTYAKEFILQNWEGDWQLLNSFVPSDPIPWSRLAAYRDWQRRRQRAVHKAIADTPGSSCTLRYAIECNRVLDSYGFRVHAHVLNNVAPDVVSLSIYEAINGWTEGITDQAALEADIASKLTSIVGRIRAETSAPIVFGEYGWPQQASYFAPLGFDVGALIRKVIDVGNSLGVEGEIYWQCCDNEEESPGNPRGFDLYLRNGNASTVGALSAAGVFFQGLLG